MFGNWAAHGAVFDGNPRDDRFVVTYIPMGMNICSITGIMSSREHAVLLAEFLSLTCNHDSHNEVVRRKDDLTNSVSYIEAMLMERGITPTWSRS